MATISGRDLYINGECLAFVQGRSDSLIGGAYFELGLPADPIRITPIFNHMDVNADAWGRAPFECQWMLAEMQVSMTLVHFDNGVLNACIQSSMANLVTATGQVPIVGTMGRAGKRMGNGLARFQGNVTGAGNLGTIGNNFMSLQLTAPQNGIPWLFYYTYLMNPPIEFPLGTERSLVPLRWRVVPYTPDPAGLVAGQVTGADKDIITGAQTGYRLFSHLSEL